MVVSGNEFSLRKQLYPSTLAAQEAEVSGSEHKSFFLEFIKRPDSHNSTMMMSVLLETDLTFDEI
jgi:hypothetical protein